MLWCLRKIYTFVFIKDHDCHKYIQVGVALCYLVVSDSLYAQQVFIASPISIPPYVFSESDTGIQIDIVKESLANAGHTPRLFYVSNNRGLNFLETKKADGAINAPAGIDGLYYSKSTIEYQNGVIALKRYY